MRLLGNVLDLPHKEVKSINIKPYASFIGNIPPTNYSFVRPMIGHIKKWFG